MSGSDPDNVISINVLEDYDEMHRVEWDEDRIVWDIGQIHYINKNAPERKGLPYIHVVKRYNEMEMGIRAHPEMNVWKCIKHVSNTLR